MTRQVNESSAMTVRIRFYNVQGLLSSPTAARYLIRDVTNSRTVRDWTTLIPAPEITLEITPEDNRLYERGGARRKFEKRVITVQANPEEDTQHSEEIEYWVRNLQGIKNGL